MRQVARMWLSPSGAVSPLHYDGHTSFLTQVKLSMWTPLPIGIGFNRTIVATTAKLNMPHTCKGCTWWHGNEAAFWVQIRGRKRLLLYPPSALSKLQPYPSWHILRRRCRLDPAKPDLERFPDFHQVCK